MAPKPWATNDESTWLQTKIPTYIAHKTSQTLFNFWPEMYEGWFRKFPEAPRIGLPDLNEDGDAPDLTPEEREALADALTARKKVSPSSFHHYTHSRTHMFVSAIGYLVSAPLEEGGGQQYSQNFHAEGEEGGLTRKPPLLEETGRPTCPPSSGGFPEALRRANQRRVARQRVLCYERGAGVEGYGQLGGREQRGTDGSCQGDAAGAYARSDACGEATV